MTLLVSGIGASTRAILVRPDAARWLSPFRPRSISPSLYLANKDALGQFTRRPHRVINDRFSRFCLLADVRRAPIAIKFRGAAKRRDGPRPDLKTWRQPSKIASPFKWHCSDCNSQGRPVADAICQGPMLQLMPVCANIITVRLVLGWITGNIAPVQLSLSADTNRPSTNRRT